MAIQTTTSSRAQSRNLGDSSTPLRSARNDKLLLALLVPIFLSGVSWAAMVPLWHTPDEQAHFAQAQDYAAVGFKPNPGPSTSQDIVISEKLLGTFRDERGNNKFTYHPEYRLPYSNSTAGFNEAEIVNLPLQIRRVFLINEATGYPPLYYWYIALINKLVWGADLITRVFVSRLATILISSAGVLAVYGLAKEVFVDRKTALAAAGLWGFMPMRQFAGSGVTSDALMNVVYPLALWRLIKLATEPSRKNFWLSIITVGAAMTVKLQSVFLIPILVAAIIIANRAGVRLGKLEKVGSKLITGIICLIFLAMVLGHVGSLANRFPRLLGYLFLPEIANFSDLYSQPTAVEYIRVMAGELYRQGFPWYFGVYRWLSLTLPIWIYRIIKVILLVSAVGWVMSLIKRKQEAVRWRPAALALLNVLVYGGGILVWNFFYWKSHGFSLGIQGRYFFPNMAEHMILLMGGLIFVAGVRFRKAVMFLAVLGMLVFNWYSWWFAASSYFDNANLYTFFIQASQYKPWFFKLPFLPGVIGLGLISSGWFLWEFGVELFKQETGNKKQFNMLSEIGVRRLVKYLIFGLWDTAFRLLPWSPLRVLWMKMFGARVAWSAVVERVNFMNLDRIGFSGLSIGRKSFVGVAAILDLAGELVIEDMATVSPGAAILTHFSVGFSDHPLVKKYPKKVSKTIIKKGAFIGAHATILAGATIGEMAVVGAGAVVTKNVSEDTLVVGVPAEVKRKL